MKTSGSRAGAALGDEHFRVLVESIADIIVIADLEGRLVCANPATAGILCFENEELHSMAILDLHPAHVREEITTVLKDLTREQEALQKFDRFFRINPALIAVNKVPGRAFHDINDAFLRTLGYTADEVIGRSAAELGLFVDQAAQIRADDGYWQQVDADLTTRTRAQFSHGVCPDCMDRLYPEYRKSSG
jgi:PAS domain-containing protein